MDFDRILALAPHTDDVEFGCGGSISKFIENKKDIYYVAFSIAEDSVPEGLPKNILEIEVKKATKKLGLSEDKLIIYKFPVRRLNYYRQEILEELIKIRNEIKPDLVFLPSLKDIHQDHQTIALEGLRAFKQSNILAYELPWNTIEFSTQAFISLEEKHVANKIEALKSYESQKERFYAKEEFIKSWAVMRGTQIGVKFAEAFEVIRWVMK